LGAADRIVRNQDDTFDMALDDWKYELPDPARREGIRCNPARFGIDRFTCFERYRKCRGGFGLDTHDPDPPAVPSGNAADQPATSDRDEKRVEHSGLLVKLQADHSLPERCFGLIECVDGERSRRPQSRRNRPSGAGDPARI
jgi:hypothetical protein